ncbi:MAG TPA: GH92 family glycosyl hydrolase [Mycobacteriales bacterium]|nr:GH92 family glycosyl hydrolase [Mycobacteriales bacterium]
MIDSSGDRDPADADPARWVDPFIGTRPGGLDFGHGGGAANTFPGATTPFGMVQWSPDTETYQHGGYHYDDNRIKGFSLTHLSGPGCGDLGNLPFLPVLGRVAPYLRFRHENERAEPGYYRVALDNGVSVELTATTRSGLARIRYPASRPRRQRAGLVVDAGAAVNPATGRVDIRGRELSGWTESGGFCGTGNRYTLYFHAELDTDFASSGDGEPRVELDLGAAETVTMRVGLSYVDAAAAGRNLAAEQGGDPGSPNPGSPNPGGRSDFAAVRTAARQRWNELLSRIAVAGGTDERRTVFYTALYHALLHPNVFSDVDGRYIGFDGQVHTVPAGHAQYANFSGWDVYRSQVQLIALLDPALAADIAQSAVNQAEHGGYWDRWTIANGGTGVMVGDPMQIIVASIYAFGGTAFDAPRALRLMERGSTDERERPGQARYEAMGYLPAGAGGVWGSVSTALEYGAADLAVAQLARRLGEPATAERFQWRAQRWRHLVRPGSGYLQPRAADTSWPPFSPTQTADYVEGNAAQYAFSVPWNVRGLFDALGGDEVVLPRLEAFFTELNAGPGKPYAYLGNEPTLHVPWLFGYAGAAHRTQDVVRRVVSTIFRAAPDGLVGNDDLGQMSSWAVWAMLGMYPLLPGRAELVLASPEFERATVRRGDGTVIDIRAPGASVTCRYVRGLRVNGREWSRPWLPESFVLAGGTLEYELSECPEPGWGSAAEDAPPSFDHVGTPAPLASYADNDSRDLDLFGCGYAVAALRAAGVRPGGQVSVGGLVYPVPAGLAAGGPDGAGPDNVLAFGQEVDLVWVPAGATRLGFLGAATHGPSAGTVLLRYADGVVRRALLGFPDWTLNGATADLEYGAAVAARMPYRSVGSERDMIASYLFGSAPIALDPGRRPVSVRLPWTVGSGRLHVFAVSAG